MKRLLASLHDREAIGDWDSACQIFHGAAAYERYRLRATHGTPNSAFESVLARLRLPQKKDGDCFRSPVAFTPAEAMKELKRLLPK